VGFQAKEQPMSSQYHLLQNFYLFKDWATADLDKVAKIAKAEVYNITDEIFSQGDSASYLYIIKYGSVRIQQKGEGSSEVEVATLGTGAHFGEMAFLDAENRSATVTAMERSEIVAISFDELRAFLSTHQDAAVKFYHALALFLCGRLRVTTTDLQFARVKNIRHF
jgi:CRP-like cAMP-binding protein